jgi:hypothetical protein
MSFRVIIAPSRSNYESKIIPDIARQLKPNHTLEAFAMSLIFAEAKILNKRGQAPFVAEMRGMPAG